jgi:predicted RNase H-like nuclease (RuvC/YqgF family)
VEKKTPAHLDIDKVKFHVIHGASIEDAIEKITPSPVVRKESKPEPESEEETALNDLVRKLRDEVNQKNSQIKQLKDYVAELKYESNQKERTIENLEMRIRKIRSESYQKVRKDKEIVIRDREIERLKRDIKKVRKSLKRQRKRAKRIKQIHKKEIRGEGLSVKIIASFAKEAIQHTKDTYGIREGDLVYLEDPSGGGPVTASILADSGVRAVLISEEMPHAALEYFYDSDIPVIRGLKLQRVDDLATIDPEALDKAIFEWEEKARERRKEKDHEQFQSILDEYRSERRRGLV